MKAILMAGGEGTRLRPLTTNTPKPLVPLCNKPVIEHMIERLRYHKITDIIITLHYMADEIASYFSTGKDYGVSITYSIEDEPLGTAGSIKKIQDQLNDTFLIISGDAIADFNLSEIVQFHKEKQSKATITLYKATNPLEFGVVITDENSKITQFIEKPSWGEVLSNTVNTGIYCIEPDILDLMERGKTYDFSNDIFDHMLKNDMPIYGCVMDGYWCDIGNLEQYRQAINDIFLKKVQTNIPGKEIKPGVWIGDNTEIHPSAQITGHVVIGKNCKIGAGTIINDFCAIGDNCFISNGSKIERSIIWSNTYIGKQSNINGTIMGKGVTAKENVLTNDGAIIGDKCFLGKQAQIKNNIKIWPEKKIEAGAVVSLSLIWGGRWLGNIFGHDGITGLANIEITPEFALKLGLAFGSYLDKGTIVNTSRDDHAASRMINRALICGLSSAGIETWDLRIMPEPVARHATRNSIAQGGIHVRINPGETRSVFIELFDNNGININKLTERKIENIFSREDFRRNSIDEIGKINFPTRLTENYTSNFLQSLNIKKIKDRAFKTVIDYGFSSASTILPMLLGKLGCETVAINAYMDSIRETQYNKKNQVNQLSKVVTTLGADLGVLLDSDSESLFLVDEKGQFIDENKLLILMSYLIFKAHPGANIAVPVTAPYYLDKLAWDMGGKIIRTKTGKQHLMESAQNKKVTFAGNCKGEFIFPDFNIGFDAMFTFAKILELTAITEISLSEIISSIPISHQIKEEVPCAFTDKSAIMHSFYRYFATNPFDITDGLKIFFEKSWVIIIPDKVEPSIHIRAEAKTIELAESLIEMVKKIIQKYSEEQQTTIPALELRQNEEEKRTDILPQKRFYFWTPGEYSGISVPSLKKFNEIIQTIEIEYLNYHLNNGDLEYWIGKQLGMYDMAKKITELKKKHLKDNDLREKLIEATKIQLTEINLQS